jgi:hypothetical protein
MIAFVAVGDPARDVVRVEVERRGSMSANTGVAPRRAIDSAVA